jgi:imidazolonepropionase-like amidohydrolase
MESAMKFSKLFLLVTAGLSLAAQAHDIVPAAKQTQPVLLQDATVHTVTNGVLKDTDVLLVDGKISAIGTDLAVPEGAMVVPLQGKQLYPGLVALANQLGLTEIEAVRATNDTTEVTNTNPDVKAQVAYNADSEVIPTIRANGFSYSLVYPDGALLMGQSAFMQLDAWNWQDATVVDSVALHIKWPRADVMPNPWRPQKPEDIRKASQKAMTELEGYFKTAKAYADAVAKGVKLPLDSRWQAMIPVFKGERPVFVHADDQRQIEQAMKFAQQYGFVLTIVGGRDAWRIAPQLAAHKVSVIYTAPYGIPERADEATSQSFQTPAQLAKAGVKFALSLDGYWDTRNVVFAAGQAISYGLSPEQALRSVTLDAAAIAGVADKIGSIEVGKAATLVVSDGDIFDYLGHKVRYMWIDGRAVDLNSRHKQLHDKYQQRYQAKN